VSDFRKALNLGEVNDMAERLMKALLIIDKQQATIADQARTIARLTEERQTSSEKKNA